MSGGAETRPGAEDARLTGRTYAVPFEDVWQAARGLAEGGQRGWTLLTADDEEGVILAKAARLFSKKVDDVRVTIRLDEDAQTRVDARVAPRDGGRDFGRSARRLGRFFKRLDAAVPEAAAARRARGLATPAAGSARGAASGADFAPPGAARTAQR